jgi:hypothetical protein
VARERGRRDDVLLVTKVVMESDGGKGLSAERIANGVEASLKRLRASSRWPLSCQRELALSLSHDRLPSVKCG